VERHYTTGFYADQMPESLRTARAVAPYVVELIAPRRVIDVGCGVGTWASAFADLGCDVRGLDGDYVDRDQLVIDADRFEAADLSRPVTIEGYDLAICLEVGEHLPPASSEALVRSLCGAPVVLFSAAIPWQGGTDHINERWQSDWARMFAAHGHVAVDCLHQRLWDDHEVSPWYAQNAVLYVAEDRLGDYPALGAAPVRPVRDVVHPGVYRMQHTNPIGLRPWLRGLPREAGYTARQNLKKARRRFGR
jgi:SAM-dependent methyltransferase